MKGQISIGILIAAMGIILTPIGYLYSQTRNESSINLVEHGDIKSRVSAIEARSERIPVIEAKLDALLSKQGIRFSEISNVATTTKR